MKKTLIIMEAPDNAYSIEQLGDENQYFLGAFGEIIGILRQTFPVGDFSDPTEITVDTDSGKLIIEIAKHTPVQSFVLHVENEETLKPALELCRKTGWRALDTDTGVFIDYNKAKGITGGNAGDKKSWWKLWRR